MVEVLFKSDPHNALKKAALISLGFHLLVTLVAYFSESFDFNLRRSEEVTYVKLSFGDGGQNTKANLKKLDSLPSASVRDQREALKQLAKQKKMPKEVFKQLPPKDVKIADKTEAPPPDRKVIKIGGGQDKPAVPVKRVSKTNSAIDKINERLKNRTEQRKQIEIGAAQAKEGETGQSPFGGADGNVIDPELIQYYNLLKRRITNEWLLSKDKFSGALLAKIEVMIDGNGRVVSTDFVKTSGDGSFDDSAMRAVRKVSPFPIPPESLRNKALREGFTFVFNPSGVSGTATTH